MKRIFFFLLLLPQFLAAQNLVVNPGFEKSTTEKSGLLSVSAVEGWTVPTKGTSDYIRPTSKQRKAEANDIPAYAHIIPYEGKACAGFHGHVGGYEYLCGTLLSPLTKDSVYTISFALATVFDHEFYPERIGVYFTREDQPYYRPDNDAQRMTVIPQLTLDSANVISESGHWKVYTMEYTATGTERKFIIGDFTNTFTLDLHEGKEANYFFLDDMYIGVSVTTIITGGIPEPQFVPPTESVGIPTDTLIAAGKTLTLENIYFETNKSRILPESYQPLYDIIVELKLQSNLKVEIVGHTDKHGNAADNQKLSEQRAQAVKDFFVSKGIDASRITTAGRGSSQPVGEDDQKNRRVEFRFYE